MRTLDRRTVTSTGYRLLKSHAPTAYLRVIGWRSADFHPVTRSVDLVVAGVPGSANSFLRSAVLIDNPDLRIASHAHVWSEVRDAVRWQRPAVLLVRDPLGAAASRITRFGGVTPREALQEYADYHRRVLRWADDVVVARFEDATRRPGDVVRRVNARYGTALRPFPHEDPETMGRLHALLSVANGAVPTGRRGSPDRDRAVAAVREELLADDLQDLRVSCRGLHAELTARWADA